MHSPNLATIRSLGYRTDLALLVGQGSQVQRDEAGWMVRTPGNPTYHWGNFLLLDAPPAPGELPGYLERFAAGFPRAEHVSVGVDGTDGSVGPAEEVAAAGLTVSRDTVLVADAVRAPAHVNGGAEYRPVRSDDDWADLLALRLAIDGDTTAGMVEFLQRSVAGDRRLVEAGHGVWLGAFVEGRVRASLGVFDVGDGLARYQNVGTHPDSRGRGLAGTLVYRAGQLALRDWAIRRLVIVADPDYHAIGLYRSIGFADTQTQVGLSRAPADGTR